MFCSPNSPSFIKCVSLYNKKQNVKFEVYMTDGDMDQDISFFECSQQSFIVAVEEYPHWRV